jgi:ATP-dependent RNA helicase RhlE
MAIEKLYKPLAEAMHEAGYAEPKELLLKSIAKINAGADIYGIGPKNCGKTTTAVIATIQKLKERWEDAPRALIIVSSKENAIAMKEQFQLLGKNTNLRAACVFEDAPIHKQFDEIYVGVDVVIGTAKRTMEIYFKQGLNINLLKLFIIDDAEMIVKQSLQGQIDRLILSLPKCQHLVFTDELGPKVEKLTEKFIKSPATIAVEA